MHQYRIYIEKQILGPYDAKDLLTLEGFSESCLVCQVGESEWQPAKQVRAIRSLLSPSSSTLVEDVAPRPSSNVLQRFQAKPPFEVIRTGDFISPNHQFDAPGRRRNNFRPTSNKFRVIELPQPAARSSFRKVTVALLLILGGSGFWTFRTTPDIPASFLAGYQAIQKMAASKDPLAFLRHSIANHPQHRPEHRPLTPKHPPAPKKRK